MINYFNFKKFNNQFLLTNDFGRYIFLEKDEFKQFLSTSHVNEETIENRLKKNGFIYDDKLSFSDEFRYSMVDSKNFLFSPTQLHIFVVTSACNLNCIYCQAHMKNSKNSTFMNKETAKLAVDFALESPTKDMTFEFQGGEPLLNFDATISALNLMLDDNAYGLSRRRVTVSTAGVVPQIYKLAEQCPVALAISLHAPSDDLRNFLVPLNKKYPLKELFAAC